MTILLVLSMSPACLAQSLSANVTINPNFSFTNTASLEAATGTSPYTLISNSFALNISNANHNTCKVYIALASAISTSSGTPMDASMLKIKFNHHNAGSNVTGVVTADIPMTIYGGAGSPGTLLFTQKKSANTYTYYYDVKMTKVGYVYAPGSYSYTFKVTMTVP